MFEPKSTGEVIAEKERKIRKTKNQRDRYAGQAKKYNTRAANYRNNKGHGIAMLSEGGGTVESDYDRAADALARQREAELQAVSKERDDRRRDAKTAKQSMDEAKEDMIRRRLAEGKVHGIILYNDKGQPVDATGKPVRIRDPRSGKTRTFNTEYGHISNDQVLAVELEERGPDALRHDRSTGTRRTYPANPNTRQNREYIHDPAMSDVVGVDAPAGTKATERGGSKGKKVDYNRETRWGHRIEKMYRDRYGDVYVIAYRDDLGYIWGRRYNTGSGFWSGGDYDLTQAQIRKKAEGMELIRDNTKGKSKSGSGKR